MGIVYKSFDPVIRRPIALKTIRKELLDEEEEAAAFGARFRNEAQAAGRLLHPGIVAVYEYGEDAHYAFIAMEYVEGASLRQYFERKVKFEDRDVVSVMAQLLEALQYAHDQGVWHRDIKPGNIIIMNNGRVKVADFGIARVENSKLTQVGVLMGTPGFIAPEQYLGKAVDHRIDVFAAGVVMYELLCGESPFSGSKEGVMYKVCHQAPRPPSVVCEKAALERFDPVALRALAKHPEDRYLSAAEFRAELLAVYDRPPSPTVSHQTLIVVAAGSAEAGDASTPRGGSSKASSAPASPGSSGRSAHVSTMPTQMLIEAGWNVGALAGVEHCLARFLGPIARVVVRRAAREAKDLPALANRVAQQIPSEADRAKFLQQVTPFMPSGPAAEHAPIAEDDQATVIPDAHADATAPGPTPEDIARATKLLTEYLGPIARFLVRQATKEPGITRAKFVSDLADRIGKPLDRERFVRDFERPH